MQSKADKKKTDGLRRKRNREYIRLYKGSRACEVCFEGRTVCLEFHHKDPAFKRFDLSDAEDKSIDRIDAEMRKCILVCSNCHKVLHADDDRTGLAAKSDEDLTPTLFDEFDCRLQGRGYG